MKNFLLKKVEQHLKQIYFPFFQWKMNHFPMESFIFQWKVSFSIGNSFPLEKGPFSIGKYFPGTFHWKMRVQKVFRNGKFHFPFHGNGTFLENHVPERHPNVVPIVLKLFYNSITFLILLSKQAIYTTWRSCCFFFEEIFWKEDESCAVPAHIGSLSQGCHQATFE